MWGDKKSKTLRNLNAKDPRVRAEAIQEVLAWTEGNSVVDILIQAVQADPSDQVREKAADALQRLSSGKRWIDDARVVELLIHILHKDPTDAVREKAAFALRSVVGSGRWIDDDLVVEILVHARKDDPQAAIQKKAADVLNKFSENDVLSKLLATVSDPRAKSVPALQQRREEAARILWMVGYRPESSEERALLAVLAGDLEAAAAEGTTGARALLNAADRGTDPAEVVRALEEISSSDLVPALVQRVIGRGTSIGRCIAAEMLVTLGGEDAATAIAESLRPTEDRLLGQHPAARPKKIPPGHAKQLVEAALPDIRSALNSHYAEKLLKQGRYKDIVAIGAPAVRAIVRTYDPASSVYERSKIWEALREIRDPAAIWSLAEVLGGRFPTALRDASMDALKKIAGPDAISALLLFALRRSVRDRATGSLTGSPSEDWMFQLSIARVLSEATFLDARYPALILINADHAIDYKPTNEAILKALSRVPGEALRKAWKGHSPSQSERGLASETNGRDCRSTSELVRDIRASIDAANAQESSGDLTPRSCCASHELVACRDACVLPLLLTLVDIPCAANDAVSCLERFLHNAAPMIPPTHLNRLAVMADVEGRGWDSTADDDRPFPVKETCWCRTIRDLASIELHRRELVACAPALKRRLYEAASRFVRAGATDSPVSHLVKGFGPYVVAPILEVCSEVFRDPLSTAGTDSIIRGLSEIGEAAVPGLILAVYCANPSVRVLAIRVLGAIPCWRSAETLIRIVEGQCQHPELESLRQLAEEALYEMGHPTAARWLWYREEQARLQFGVLGDLRDQIASDPSMLIDVPKRKLVPAELLREVTIRGEAHSLEGSAPIGAGDADSSRVDWSSFDRVALAQLAADELLRRTNLQELAQGTRRRTKDSGAQNAR